MHLERCAETANEKFVMRCKPHSMGMSTKIYTYYCYNGYLSVTNGKSKLAQMEAAEARCGSKLATNKKQQNQIFTFFMVFFILNIQIQMDVWINLTTKNAIQFD